MMESNILKLLRKRRSIRHFTDQPIETSKVDAIIEAALRSPTSRARSPWEFIAVTDKNLLSQMGEAKEHGSAFLANAPLVIVVAADANKSDVYIEDCSIAAFNMQLAAEEIGLGSCWVQIRLRAHSSDCSSDEYLIRRLDLPASHRVVCMLGIGYPAEEKVGHPAESLCYGQVHKNRYRCLP